MDRARELLEELRDHWDDHYWWARNWWLQVIAMALISGLVGVLFAWMQEQVHPLKAAT